MAEKIPENADLARQLIEKCRRYGIVLATAESCTGGLIGGALTSVPGASDVYTGGIISYSNAIKESVLGVPGKILVCEGAVSAPAAEAMALGAARLMNAQLSVAVTGIAGPGGATPEKPVGLVFVCVAAKDEVKETRRCHFSGDRENVRQQTVREALKMLSEYAILTKQ